MFWRMSVTRQLMYPIDFHIMEGKKWGTSTVWLSTFFKISSFVFSRRKKFMQVWNNLRVSKCWQNFHFLVKSQKWRVRKNITFSPEPSHISILLKYIISVFLFAKMCKSVIIFHNNILFTARLICLMGHLHNTVFN